MKNDRARTIFTSIWSMSISTVVQKFQPNPKSKKKKMTIEGQQLSVAEEKKSNKKSRQGHSSIGDPVCGQDAPKSL